MKQALGKYRLSNRDKILGAGIALCIHTGLLLNLKDFHWQKPIQTQYQPISLTMHAPDKVAPASKAVPAEPNQKTVSKRSNISRDIASPALPDQIKANETPAPKGYENLLPKVNGGELSAPSGGSPAGYGANRQPYRGSHLTELKAENGFLSNSFDIPLVSRRGLSAGHATTRIHLLPDNSIEIESLIGDRMIRAALFEALNQRESLKKLDNIFRYFATRTFQLSAEVSTESGAKGHSEFEVRSEVFDQEVLIHIVKFSSFDEAPPCVMKVSPGLNDPHDELFLEHCVVKQNSIDDKDAKLARTIDGQHQSRLMESAAYKTEITHYVLSGR